VRVSSSSVEDRLRPAEPVKVDLRGNPRRRYEWHESGSSSRRQDRISQTNYDVRVDGDWPGWHYEVGYNDRSQHGRASHAECIAERKSATRAHRGQTLASGEATLAWSSSNADAASLTPFGSVETTGANLSPIKPAQTIGWPSR